MDEEGGAEGVVLEGGVGWVRGEQVVVVAW